VDQRKARVDRQNNAAIARVDLSPLINLKKDDSLPKQSKRHGGKAAR
jgi:hypothetical protein